MDLFLKGKVVLVSGGAQGIGEAIVRAFAGEGAVPIILDRNHDRACALVSELREQGCNAHSVKVELSEAEEIRLAVRDVLKERSRIDILINNAGTNDGVSLGDQPGAFEFSLRKNLLHVFTLSHYCLEALKATKGAIVNVSSKVAATGQGGTSGYAAAKGAINSLTREWAVELAEHGIRVNTVVPAEVLTPQYESWLASVDDSARARAKKEAFIPLGRRFTEAGEIADTVAFLASARSSHTTGQIVFVDGGYTHLDRACVAE